MERETSFDLVANPLVPAAIAGGRSDAFPGMGCAMNPTLKAVIIEVSGGNVRNHPINLRGTYGLFPDDCLGGRNATAAAKTVTLEISGETAESDIDESKAIFRERGAIRQSFEKQDVVEGDLVLIERVEGRTFRVSKASKRGFKYYL